MLACPLFFKSLRPEQESGRCSIGWTSQYQAFPVAVVEIEVGFERGISVAIPTISWFLLPISSGKKKVFNQPGVRNLERLD